MKRYRFEMLSWLRKHTKSRHLVEHYDEQVVRRIHDAVGEDELVERHTREVVRGELPVVLASQSPFHEQQDDLVNMKDMHGETKIIDSIKTKTQDLDYDLEAHRWILYTLVVFIFYTIVLAWQIANIRDAIIASAEGQRSIYNQIDILQKQINVLQQQWTTKLQYLPSSKKESTQSSTPSSSPPNQQTPANSEKTF
jgi:hypothetical protein